MSTKEMTQLDIFAKATLGGEIREFNFGWMFKSDEFSPLQLGVLRVAFAALRRAIPTFPELTIEQKKVIQPELP